MTADAMAILQFLFSAVWSLFTSWHIPGTRASPAEWAFFALTVVVLFQFIRRFGDSSGGKDGS